MENRQAEIQECRRQVQELTRQVAALSARVDELARAEASQSIPAYTSGARQEAVQVPQQAEKQVTAPRQEERYPNLENTVGKNLFAVLASVLVLLGVGVFISTIYEQIPEMVKILAIYAFGFVLLGSGLVLHRRNDNNFWLGVASCGLAELLVSVITSHSYFDVLPLPGAFGLILLWIIGSFLLTKVHPTVFKTIGYIGFTISMILGLSLLKNNDLVMYLSLLVSFVVLAVFFMVTNGKYVKMNTVLAFANVLNLCQFLSMDKFLPEGMAWVSFVVALAVTAVLHGIYLFRAKLSRDAYPIFALASLGVVSLFMGVLELAVTVPLALILAFALWCVSHKTGARWEARVGYSAFAAIYLLFVAFNMGYGPWEQFFWFLGFAGAAYGLYFLTRKRDIAWLGVVCFGLFYLFAGRIQPQLLWWTFGAALGFFTLSGSKLVRADSTLQTAWYLLLFSVLYTVKYRVQDSLFASAENIRDMRDISEGVFYLLMSVANTVYLHFTLSHREKILQITPKGIVVMALQCVLLVNCVMAVDSRIWYVALMGVVGSMLILCYSLRYSFRTKGSDRRLMVWQFAKFTVYCWIILMILDSPSILMNVSLLLIAILAVVLGFRLGHKSVRIYGLVLSLLDVVSLVLFHVDLSDSLQFAGGIVLCGVLCFVISFIYSRISKPPLKQKPNRRRRKPLRGKKNHDGTKTGRAACSTPIVCFWSPVKRSDLRSVR